MSEFGSNREANRLFCARDKPEKFTELGAGRALSGSHQAHKRRVTRGFSAHSRL